MNEGGGQVADLYLTYCSADKDHASGELPALQRYRSSRILAVHDASMLAGADFGILSGRFGLLAAEDPIPDYDHLLTAFEVEAQAALVAEQLAQRRPGTVFFFCRTLADDPAVGPYRDCMEAASLGAGMRFLLIEMPPGEPTAMQLLDLVAICRGGGPAT